MAPLPSIGDNIKGFAKSTQDFFDGLLHLRRRHRHNPIEIMKRLQREAFSDLMKLRDRLDKMERILPLYKTSGGTPFQEAGTNVRGEVDFVGAIAMLGDMDQEHYDALDRAGVRSGIISRFTFETTVRQKDTLVAEFVASQKSSGHSSDVSTIALSLAKVLYVANISSWFSAFAIPVGAQFRDLGFSINTSSKRKGLSDTSFVGPPLLNQFNGMAIGLAARRSNVTALMAHSFSGHEMQPYSGGIGHCFNTFGQVVCQLPRGIQFSLLGQHQVPKSSSQHIKLGILTIPVGFLKCEKPSEAFPEAFGRPAMDMGTYEISPTGSIAAKVEKEVAENTKIGGWIQMKISNPKHLQWAINAFDDSEDEFGWGLSFSGTSEVPGRFSRLQGESYVNLNLGRKFSLKPGLMYAEDNNARIFALMLRSNWSF